MIYPLFLLLLIVYGWVIYKHCGGNGRKVWAYSNVSDADNYWYIRAA